ncbi:MAG: bifunctional molybdenum cofactor biosynthesis protein MoaC/MoaB [Armatimonadota bacterium]
MRDISKKFSTFRTATAQATVTVSPSTIVRIQLHDIPKGDPLEVAKVAGIQAAKNTSQIIPYCHPLPVEFVGIEFALDEQTIRVTVTVKAVHKTGVEMEALTAAGVAALTLYDMLKMIDDHIAIGEIKLISKRGGKSDFAEKAPPSLTAAVLVMSDSVAAGEKDDQSGRMIAERLTEQGVKVIDYNVVPDDTETIVRVLTSYADTMKVDLVLTTGGTGFSTRDRTPEAMAQVIEREIPGIPEAMRAYGQARTPYAMLSRGKAGIRGNTIIVNLPGSRKGVEESLDALFPGLLHAFKMLAGGGHEDGRQSRAKEER